MEKLIFSMPLCQNHLTFEYEIIDENGADWAEGKEVATEFSIQVDIFSKTDSSIIEEKVKEKMIAQGFIRESARGLWEEDTKLFHCAMRFKITGLANG